MNDCTLDADVAAAAIATSDAWTSGFGIYPALETVARAGAYGDGAARRGAGRRIALAGMVLGAIGVAALIADAAVAIGHA